MRGKNWPVFGGKEQIKMITSGTNSHNQVNPAPRLSPRGRARNGQDRSASPSKKFIKDPHTSLNLYQEQQEDRQPLAPNAVPPREPHRPGPREMSDLFAAGHEDYEPVAPGASPRRVVKENVVAPKGAGHKKFQPSRLFGEDDEDAPVEKKIYKTNPARYDHFDIGDSFDDAFQHRSENRKPQDMPIRPKAGRSTQHNSQWGFEDSATPEKTKQRVRDQDVVHFGIADNDKGQDKASTKQPGKGRKDQETHFDMQDDGTPIYQPIVPKPRKDADAHFDFTDEPTPAPRRIIARTQAASKLYDDPVFGHGHEDEDEAGQPLGKISNNAHQNFHSYWDQGDDFKSNGKTGHALAQRKDQQQHWGANEDDTAPKRTKSAVTQGREKNDSFWDF